MRKWKSVPDETPIDVSGLIPKGIRSRRQLNIIEAENIHQATVKYLAAKPSRRQAPFTFNWVFKIHREMFGNVWIWAGCCRQCELNIGIPYHQIPTATEELLRDLAYWRQQQSIPVAEQAVRLHHRSASIHPFENGNGRWARLLANIWLRQQKHPIVRWPDQVIGSESAIRREYIVAIKAADNYDYNLLAGLHEKFSARDPD